MLDLGSMRQPVTTVAPDGDADEITPRFLTRMMNEEKVGGCSLGSGLFPSRLPKSPSHGLLFLSMIASSVCQAEHSWLSWPTVGELAEKHLSTLGMIICHLKIRLPRSKQIA